MLAGYEVLDHAVDFELKVHAPTWSELLGEAARALSTRLQSGMRGPPSKPGNWHIVELHAPNRAALLARWLNELLFEAEAGWWVPVEFVIDRATPESLHARIRCVSVDRPSRGMTAGAAQGVRITPGRAGGLEATVAFTYAPSPEIDVCGTSST